MSINGLLSTCFNLLCLSVQLLCLWKWKWKWSHSVFVTPWTVAYQAPPSIGFSRQEYWSGLPFSFSRGSSRPRDWTLVSRIPGRCFNLWAVFRSILSMQLTIFHLEKAMTPYSSTLAWKILWMEGPGRLQSMGSQRLSDFTFTFNFKDKATELKDKGDWNRLIANH